MNEAELAERNQGEKALSDTACGYADRAIPHHRKIMLIGFRGFPGIQGGIETHVENLSPRLAQLGYRVTACVRTPYVGPEAADEWRGVRFLRVWTTRNAYFEAILHSLLCAMVAAVRRPDIVHVHGIGPALIAPLLRLFGLRVVVTHHGEDYNREKWGLLARSILQIGEYLGMRFASQRIAISRNIASLIADKHGRSCDIIPNGVQIPDLPTQTDKIVELGLVPGRYIVTVGRIVPEKRQLDLLHAFVAARLNGWKLAIVGQVDHRNKYADFLAEEAAGKDGVVMAGFQSGESLRQLYAHAGLFVLPSSHEGLPIALLEALSYGVPVLVSDIASNLEVVSDASRIFRMGDVSDLSEKMSALISSPLSQAARVALRNDCALRYDWTEIAVRTDSAYRVMFGAYRFDAKRQAEASNSNLPPLGTIPTELQPAIRQAQVRPRAVATAGE